MTCRRTLLVGIAALTLARLTLAAQPPKVRRVALLVPGSRSSWGRLVDLFQRRLRELGYVDGTNIQVEERYDMLRASTSSDPRAPSRKTH